MRHGMLCFFRWGDQTETSFQTSDVQLYSQNGETAFLSQPVEDLKIT